jgi:hypothetical protein
LILLPGSMLLQSCNCHRSPPILPGRPFAGGFSACLAALIGPLARAGRSRLESPSAAQPWRLSGRFAENVAKQRGKAVVYRLPRPRSKSTLPVETETRANTLLQASKN